MSQISDATTVHFNVAGPRIWNLLPEEITSAQSLSNVDVPSASQDIPLREIIS